MASKKVTLADRINNPDRMSRAVNIHLSSLPSEENIDVNSEETELIESNNTIIKDKIKNIDNIQSKIIDNGNGNGNVNIINNDLEKPLIKPLGNINTNDLDNDIIKDKNNDKENTNIISKYKPNDKNNPESLTELIKQKVAEIERLQRDELAPISFTKKKEKIKFDDKNPIISFPARPEIDEIINIINCKTGVKKYKIFEMLILQGLKGTKFE